MSVLTPVRIPSRLEQSWEVASDVLIVMALIYGFPLVVGLGVMVVRFLSR